MRQTMTRLPFELQRGLSHCNNARCALPQKNARWRRHHRALPPPWLVFRTGDRRRPAFTSAARAPWQLRRARTGSRAYEGLPTPRHVWLAPREQDRARGRAVPDELGLPGAARQAAARARRAARPLR